MSSIKVAEVVARMAHRGQKYGNQDYFTKHVLSVVDRVEADERSLNGDIMVAFLHDVVEDTDVTLHDLAIFGFNKLIVEAVAALTRRPGEPYDDYIRRVCEDRYFAPLVKYHDLQENLSNDPPESLRKRYEKALETISEELRRREY
jgi:hypothetical protein